MRITAAITRPSAARIAVNCIVIFARFNMCDHTIAYMNDFIVQSEIADIVKNEAYGWNTYSKTMNGLTRGDEKVLKEDYTGRDFLDRRKTMMTMFNNCPYCGENINWREIKKAI